MARSVCIVGNFFEGEGEDGVQPGGHSMTIPMPEVTGRSVPKISILREGVVHQIRQTGVHVWKATRIPEGLDNRCTPGSSRVEKRKRKKIGQCMERGGLIDKQGLKY